MKRYVLAKICGLLKVIVRTCSQAWACSLIVCSMYSGIIWSCFFVICTYLYMRIKPKKSYSASVLLGR